MTNVVHALGRAEFVQQCADAVPHGCNRAFVCLAQERLERGECHLDRVAVGAVGRQEQEMRAGAS